MDEQKVVRSRVTGLEAIQEQDETNAAPQSEPEQSVQKLECSRYVKAAKENAI